MPTKKKPKQVALYTHLLDKRNTERLRKCEGYSPQWIMPELPAGDPLLGLDLRYLIESERKLVRHLQEKIAEKDHEIATLKKQLAVGTFVSKLKAIVGYTRWPENHDRYK
ncbi:hypothetical protein EBZ39_00410 [bacterium]|nr:hypothetical protein [bacterium]